LTVKAANLVLGGAAEVSTTTDIVVDVVNANDKPPVFAKPLFSATISEGLPAGTLVSRETVATSSDGGDPEENIVDYEIENTGKESQQFEIKSDGSVYTTAELDRDTMTGATGSVFLKIIATDRGSPKRSSVPVFLRVTVADVKDTNPVIISTQSTFSVPEGKVGSITPPLVAVDTDLNDPLTWTL
jgi:hypothetical protein